MRDDRRDVRMSPLDRTVAVDHAALHAEAAARRYRLLPAAPDRFAVVRMYMVYPRAAAYLVHAGVDQFEIAGIAVDETAVAVGDDDPELRTLGDGPEALRRFFQLLFQLPDGNNLSVARVIVEVPATALGKGRQTGGAEVVSFVENEYPGVRIEDFQEPIDIHGREIANGEEVTTATGMQ